MKKHSMGIYAYLWTAGWRKSLDWKIEYWQVLEGTGGDWGYVVVFLPLNYALIYITWLCQYHSCGQLFDMLTSWTMQFVSYFHGIVLSQVSFKETLIYLLDFSSCLIQLSKSLLESHKKPVQPHLTSHLLAPDLPFAIILILTPLFLPLGMTARPITWPTVPKGKGMFAHCGKHVKQSLTFRCIELSVGWRKRWGTREDVCGAPSSSPWFMNLSYLDWSSDPRPSHLSPLNCGCTRQKRSRVRASACFSCYQYKYCEITTVERNEIDKIT